MEEEKKKEPKGRDCDRDRKRIIMIKKHVEAEHVTTHERKMKTVRKVEAEGR